MKKSVMLMAGVLAMALAGSAQAATMFAVQGANSVADPTIVDKFLATDSGQLAITLSNLPNYNQATTVPQGNLHAVTTGAGYSYAAMILQHISTLNASSKFPASSAPNFSFYRINKDNSNVYSLPAVNTQLGFFNFGTMDATKDPNDPLARKNLAFMYVNTEGSTTNTNAWTATGGLANNPSNMSWWTTSNASTPAVPVANVTAERMRLSSVGNLGIGSTDPKTKLHVTNLPYYTSNASALAAGLTAGAFYMCGGNGTAAYVAPTDTASQSLCVTY